MKEKKLVPKLRFPGFTEPWEQRKVNEIFKVTRGQVLAASLTTPKKNRGNIYPVYSSQTKDNGLLGYYSEYLFENAITWTTDGANAGTVNFRPGRFYSTNVNGVLINENGYACYAVSEIINKVAYKYVSKVGNPKLMNNVMAEINIMITPDIDELKQISKLIEAYNQYITLHQRKLEHLKLKKKSLLQKLFPKEGEVYPELRFPGFTEPWEQRKLGDLYKRINERNDGTLGRNKWISVAKMYFQDPEKVQSNNLDTRTYVMKKGDIAFEGHPNNEFKFGRFVLNDIGTGIISELFPIYRPITEYDLNFWKYAIQFERVMAPIFAKSITSSGNSSNKLDQNHFLNQTILVPPISEQKEIGAILERTTNLITLHQRKLEHLQLLKKALLQQLFV